MATLGAGGGQGDDILSQVDAAIAGQIAAPSKKKSPNGSDQPNLFQGLVHDVRDLIFGRNPKDPLNQAAAGVQGTPITPLPAVQATPLQESKAPEPPMLGNKAVDGAISGDSASKGADGSKNLLKTIGKVLGIGL